MIKTVLLKIDTEIRTSIVQKLKDYFPQINICGTTSCCEEATQIIKDQKPQLVFIDGDNSEQNSFSNFQNNALKNIETVYFSQSSSFALQAFKYKASGFILKPIETPDLIATINEVEKRIFRKRKNTVLENQDLSSKKQNPPGNLIGIPTFEGFDFIPITKIIRCEGMHKCTRIIIEDREDLISSYNIGAFIKRLEPFQFFLTHKSHLINLNHLKKYLKEGTIQMIDDSFVPVAKRRKSAFLNSMLLTR